jgi:hypothetical protein
MKTKWVNYRTVVVGVNFVHKFLNLFITQCHLLTLETLFEFLDWYWTIRIFVVVAEGCLQMVLFEVGLALKATRYELGVVYETWNPSNPQLQLFRR